MFETLTGEGNERSRKSRVFVTGGRIDRDTRLSPLPPPPFRLPSSSLKSPSHHSQGQFAHEKPRLRSQSKSQGKDQTISWQQRHYLAYKPQVKLHARLGPRSRTAEEETMRVRKAYPPVAADLLLPVPLFVSENPSGFHPSLHTMDHLAQHPEQYLPCYVRLKTQNKERNFCSWRIRTCIFFP